jgi:S-DNA-T family DNA segregation ATPase FtsK/SpoIIIE
MSPAWLVSLLNIFQRFQRFSRDVVGVALLAISLMTLLALLFPELTSGALLQAWRNFLRVWLGWGSILVAISAAALGLMFLRRQQRAPLPVKQESLLSTLEIAIPWPRLFALELAAFAALMLLSVVGGHNLARVEAGLDGGRIGWGLVELMRVLLNPLGLGALLVVGFLSAVVCFFMLVYGLGIGPWLTHRLEHWLGIKPAMPAFPEEPAVSVGAEAPPAAASPTGVPAAATRRHEPIPAEFRKRFRIGASSEEKNPPPPRAERLPPLTMLANDLGSRPDERSINMTAGLLEKTLAEFGIPAKVIGFRVGPTVTQFAVEPGFVEKTSSTEEELQRMKVRVAQIAGLHRDLALALSAERLRIEAPVPGRPYVGIEVPNARSTIVRLRPILETEAFYRIGSPLSIALGRDVSGQPVVADLARMPHLLIAGTTGSGKSVCIAALTTCLVMNNTPEDLRLVMVDPKMVELVRFNGLPHLYGKVETDVERIQGVLRWVVAEMDKRYKLLEELSARNLEAYNRKIQRRKGLETLPHIVVMIDELADLMMSAPEQTEHTLVRLAQMARATGIHLVVATQRPSTDVVTGLIKANFPARIAFAVASGVDSRVIIDSVGAESLLGNGDMLFLPPEASSPMRCQGVMISDQEVEKVITFWQQMHPTPESAASPWEKMLAEAEVTADRDDLVIKAIKLVRDTQRASASMLQRRLRIGYPRAARLVDELEELGVIGPGQGGGREREVLIGPDDPIPGAETDDSDDNEEEV